MDKIKRTIWVKCCEEYFEAYIDYRLEGKEKRKLTINDRVIEILFFAKEDHTAVRLYCPDVHRSLEISLGETEEIIKMFCWLAFDAPETDVCEIVTSDPEEEYRLIRELLVKKYRLCYEDCACSEVWMHAGEESFILILHDRQINVYLSPEENYIVAFLYCPDNKRRAMACVLQEEKDPQDIIRLIQDLSQEPEIIEFVAADPEWEHDLIREALFGGKTEAGLYIERFPFVWAHRERRFLLHNRDIRLQFVPRGEYMDIVIKCLTTGRSCTVVLAKSRSRNDEYEVSEKVIRSMQELAWEDV